MKKLYLFLLLASPFLVNGQWTTDPLINTIVSDDPSMDEAVPLSTEGPDGKTYVSYFKNVSGN